MRSLAPIQLLKDAAKQTFPAAYDGYLRWLYKRVPISARIAPILVSQAEPICYDEQFDRLQSRYTKWWEDYGYDGYSTWARGFERAAKLLTVPELRGCKLEVFEAGCGDGMTSYALANYDHDRRVTLNDTEDWRDSRTKGFPFVRGNVCSRLPLDSDSFDLVITYNTFEHIDDPKAALVELTRLCRSGGFIYIEFDPLYCSPLGLHAFSFLMPYPQFLFSPSLIDLKVRELGIDDLGKDSRSLQPTNGWRIDQFRTMWRTCGCEVISLKEGADARHLAVVAEFPKAFCGRGLTVDDLVTHRVSILLRKP
jgi:SAM-dependent methyltransferase